MASHRLPPAVPPGAQPWPAPAEAEPTLPAVPRLHSTDLFGDHREVLIEHQSQLYRLRLTALGKLILTK